ncbi:MAG: restriction endonuclease, partial [Oxalobacter sp.]
NFCKKCGRSTADAKVSIDHLDGHEFEYYCADLLEKVGFTNVDVTKGSGDQGVDIIANKGKLKYAIQCKCYSSPLGNTPIQEVFTGMHFYGCDKAAVMTNSTFTQGGRSLARKTGVELWDRSEIEKMIAYTGRPRNTASRQDINRSQRQSEVLREVNQILNGPSTKKGSRKGSGENQIINVIGRIIFYVSVVFAVFIIIGAIVAVPK